MANIKITTQHTLYDGIPITFRAPCGSADVDGLVIGSQAFTLCDTNGNTYLKANGLFSKGAYVRVILDTTKNLAYLQGVGGSSSAASDSGYDVGDIKHTMNANQSPEWLYCDGTIIDAEMYDELNDVLPYNGSKRTIPNLYYFWSIGTISGFYGFTNCSALPVAGQWAFWDQYYPGKSSRGKYAYVYDMNTETLTRISCPNPNTGNDYGFCGMTHDGARYVICVFEKTANTLRFYTSENLSEWTLAYTVNHGSSYAPAEIYFDGTYILTQGVLGGNFYVYRLETSTSTLTKLIGTGDDKTHYFIPMPNGYWARTYDGLGDIYVYSAGSGTQLFSIGNGSTAYLAYFGERYFIGMPKKDASVTSLYVGDLIAQKNTTIALNSLLGVSNNVYIKGAEYNKNTREWTVYVYVNNTSNAKTDNRALIISEDADPTDKTQYRVKSIDTIPDTLYYAIRHLDGSQVTFEVNKASAVALPVYYLDPNQKYLPTIESDAYTFINVGKCKERITFGDTVYAADSLYRPLAGLSLYGKSMQNGTPSPASPVPITSVGNTVNITTVGKNLAASGFTHTYSGTGKVSVSCRVDSSEIVLNGTSDAGHSWSVFDNVFLPKGTYTASVNGLNNSDAIVDRVYIYNHTTGSVVVNHIKDHTPRTFTLDKDSTIRFDIVLGGGRTYDNQTVRIQVEHGDKATEYVPYKRHTQAFAAPNGLNGIPVNSDGNYTDDNGQEWVCDEIDYERGVYIQRVYKVVLDGSQTLYDYRSADNTETYIGARLPNVPNCAAKQVYRSLSSFLVTGDATTNGYFPNTFLVNSSDNTLYMRVEIDGVSSAATLKTWLAANPQEVQYVLAEPIETPLSNVTHDGMVTLKGGTTMWNDTHAGMKITYVAGGTSDDET